jgi:AcrR family transcriptional regulator
MGRKAGISAQQTREDLLSAAATVFSRRGYEGASISEITAEAGLSSGSVYAHFEGKAELFMAVLEAHTRSELANRLHDDAPFDIADLLRDVGSSLESRSATDRSLLIEAVMAAKRDEKVHAMLSKFFTENHLFLTAALGAAQGNGSMDPDFSANAAARLIQMVWLGALVLELLDTPEANHEEWAHLIARVVNGFRPSERARARGALRSKGV